MKTQTFDVTIVGKAIPGLIAGARAAKSGLRVLVVADPGPSDGTAHFPFFHYTPGSLWDQLFESLGLSFHKSLITETQTGDPAFSYLSPDATLSFRHTTDPEELLLAHNTFLPDDFFCVLKQFKHAYLTDQDNLQHMLWRHLNSNKATNTPLSSLFEKRQQWIPAVVPQSSWQWSAFLRSVSVLLGTGLKGFQTWSSLYQLTMPRGFRISGGSFTIASELIRLLQDLGASVVFDSPVEEILIDHRAVKGVVCRFPYGVLFSRLVLLNTSKENIQHAVPRSFRAPMNAHDRAFETIPKGVIVSQFPGVNIDSKVRRFLTFPVVGAETYRQSFDDCFGVFEMPPNNTFNLLPATVKSPLLSQRLGISGVDNRLENLENRSYPSFHQSGKTAFPNVLFCLTTKGLSHGPVGHLISGMWHARWIHETIRKST